MSQLAKRVAIAAASGPKALGAYSPAILVEGNKTLYISGQLGLQVTDDLSTRFDMMPIQADGELVPGVEAQTRQALVNMGHLLKAAGCDHRHVVKTTVLLKDIKDFPVVNDVYAEFFREDPPARATYQVLPLKQYVSVTVTCFPQRWELCPGLQVLKWRLLLWSAWLVSFVCVALSCCDAKMSSFCTIPRTTFTLCCRWGTTRRSAATLPWSPSPPPSSPPSCSRTRNPPSFGFSPFVLKIRTEQF